MNQDRRESVNSFNNPEFRDEFRKELKDNLDSVTLPIITLLQKHDERIAAQEAKTADHESKFNRQAGFMAAIAFGWSAMLAAGEHILFHKKG